MELRMSLPVGDPVCVAVRVGVFEGVPEGVSVDEALPDMLLVTDWVPEGVSPTVGEAVTAPPAVKDPVGDLEGVDELDVDLEVVPLRLSVLLGLWLGEAPELIEAVGVEGGEGVPLGLSDCEGVTVGVALPAPPALGDRDGDTLEDRVGDLEGVGEVVVDLEVVPLRLSVLLGLWLGEAPELIEAVGVEGGEGENDALPDLLLVTDRVPEGVPPPEEVGEEVPEGVPPPVGDALPDLLLVTDRVPEGVPPPVGDALPDLLLVTDRVPEGVPPPEGVGDVVPEGVPPPVGDALPDLLLVTVFVAEQDCVGERDFVGDAVGVTVTDGEGVGLENFHIMWDSSTTTISLFLDNAGLPVTGAGMSTRHMKPPVLLRDSSPPVPEDRLSVPTTNWLKHAKCAGVLAVKTSPGAPGRV